MNIYYLLGFLFITHQNHHIGLPFSRSQAFLNSIEHIEYYLVAFLRECSETHYTSLFLV